MYLQCFITNFDLFIPSRLCFKYFKGILFSVFLFIRVISIKYIVFKHIFDFYASLLYNIKYSFSIFLYVSFAIC